MASRIRGHMPAATLAVVALAVVGWWGLRYWIVDFQHEAWPAFSALLRGHLVGFLQAAPAYGGSLILRAPFVAAVGLRSHDELTVFRASAVPCMLAAGILAVWLDANMRRAGRPRSTRFLVVVLCAANPLTVTALRYSHPEDVLGAVLSVGAVLAAMRDRPIWSGILLGLAIANKEWGVLAAGPVIVALPSRRPRALLTAAGVAGLVLAPLALATAGSGGFLPQVKSAAVDTTGFFGPWQAWWFLGARGHEVLGNVALGYRVGPGWVQTLAHPLIVALLLPLTWLFARRRAAAERGPDVLLLLALLMLMRCVLDPWDNAYYPLPCLLALLAWESEARQRMPVLTLAGSLAAWFSFKAVGDANLPLSPDAQSVIFMALAIPATAALAARLYAPEWGRRLLARPRRQEPVPGLA